MTTQVNRLKCAISNAPGASGALTIGAAASGYRAFDSAHDGLSFDCLFLDGAAWEVRTGCVYTHSGTSLSRGTLEDSSSGSAISLTSSTAVVVTATAGAANAAQAVLTEADRSAHYGFFAASNGSTTQTVTDATWTALHGGSGGALQTVDYNAGSVWSADSQGRFTPPAGRWLIGGCATADGVSTGQRLMLGVRKNGAAGNPFRLLARSGPAASTNIVGLSGSVIVEANGTDYFQLVCYLDGSGTHAVGGSAGYSYFWGEYMGPLL